jgi:hypothetical protein
VLESREDIRRWLLPAAEHGRFRIFRIAAPADSRASVR